MIDNKEESVRKARARVGKLGLGNMTVIQSNIDYFNGNFDVGVALHACGVATDLVLKACLAKRASFVLCPCCYGNLALEMPINYPQSQLFDERSITRADYSTLARMADWNNETGRLAMAVIDMDRLAVVVEQGYTGVLKRLRPSSCTPKHNLISGRTSKM